MNDKNLFNFVKYKKDKDFEKLETEFLPLFEKFVALSEEYIFYGNFSEKMLKIRNFCLINYLRMIFCEAEYRVKKKELHKEILNIEYAKISKRMKIFKKDIEKILNCAK